MKTFIIFTMVLFGFFQIGLGQNDVLVLIKKSNLKERRIEAGRKMKVFDFDGEKSRGELRIPNDSTIVVGSDTLLIKNVWRINCKSPVNIFTGGVVTGGGGFVTVLGIDLITETSGTYVNFLAVALGIPMLVTGAIVTTGGVLLMTKGKSYKSRAWQFRINQT